MRMLTSLAAAVLLLSAAAPVLASGSFTPTLYLASKAKPSYPVGFRPQDLEPEIRVDTSGRIFVSAIHGVPAGTDLFQVAPSGAAFTYLGEPDLPLANTACPSPSPEPCYPVLGLGGGDTDLAIGSFNSAPAGFPLTQSVCSPSASPSHCSPGPLLITSLNLLTVYGAIYDYPNFPATPPSGFIFNPNTSGIIVGNDRQWNNANGGLERYNVVHDLTTASIHFSKSLDGGLIWQNGTPTTTDSLTPANTALFVQNNELGPIVVDQNYAATHPGKNPILYNVFTSISKSSEIPICQINGCPEHTVWVSRSLDDGQTWHAVMVHDAPCTVFPGVPVSTEACTAYDHIFPSLGIDAVGNVYAVYSDNNDVFISYSKDHGLTWSPQQQVTNSAKDGGYNIHIFPWIAAGWNGGVDVVYYEGKDPTSPANDNNDPNAVWHVGMAQNVNLTGVSGVPNLGWQYYIADDLPYVHKGQVCEVGISCATGGNRNLSDDFQIAMDMTGHANIAFTTDSHFKDQQTTPQTYFTKQIYGYNVGTPNGGGPNQGCNKYGTTLTGGTVAASLPLNVRVKAPQGFSRGWMTLVLNHTIAGAGYLTRYQTVPGGASFTGATTKNVPFSGTIVNNVLSVKLGTAVVKASLQYGPAAY